MSNPVGSVPAPNESLRGRGYGTGTADFANNNPTMTSPLAQSAHGYGELGAAGADGGNGGDAYRSASTASTTVGGSGLSRNNTLKKRSSVRRTGSVKRSSSRRSMKAGSIKGVGAYDNDDGDYNSAFFTPIPTSGSPTEALADRFQAWRQLLKSLITYFREIQNSYEARAKALHKVQNTIANLGHPSVFMNQNGLGEATRILDDFHKRSIAEANKSRDIEDDVIGALTGLRSDLGQKIKEIKSLNGDFKNSVEKEKDITRKEVEKLQEALANSSFEDASGKNDPYVVRLGVDRAIEKQIDEENYLHRAYLNLESSGRELESIVVGEIQKAYNALAGILKREGDDAYSAVEGLRTGPVSMPKDQEWYNFVASDEHFVDPSIPLRRIEDITYPGKNHPAASEIRAGMLERKSKYLKSYTPGWYVLSPTHLHEFKSADKIYSQPPVMSLYLPDQKLGSHSETGSSSHKFMLKGKQSGGLHKGHNWVFRAESQETMLAWFDDIKNLTEKTGEERIAFVRQHARSVSGQSDRATVSSDGMDEDDEADQTPYSTDVAAYAEPVQRVQRPQAGGRFPSDLALRTLGSRVAVNDSDDEADAVVAAVPVASSAAATYGGRDPYRLEGVDTGSVPDEDFAVPDQKVLKEVAPVVVAAPGAAAPASAAPPAAAAVAPSPAQQYPQAVPAPSAQHLNDLVTAPSPTGPETAPLGDPVAKEDNVAPIVAAALGGAGLGVLASSGLHEKPTELEPEGVIGEPAATISGEPIIPPVGLTEPVQGPPATARSISALPTSVADSVAPASPDATPLATVASSGLGGNEARGAHVTGSFFPSVVRHNTDISVSQLHVPGEFPKGK